MFGGFGPIIAAIVYLIISYTSEDFSLGGFDVFVAVISTYLLAFVQAGASVFNQIEKWSLAKASLCHMLSIYAAYICCYLVNSWIPFDIAVVGIFTAIFVAGYFVIWLTVFFTVKATITKMNKNLG